MIFSSFRAVVFSFQMTMPTVIQIGAVYKKSNKLCSSLCVLCEALCDPLCSNVLKLNTKDTKVCTKAHKGSFLLKKRKF